MAMTKTSKAVLGAFGVLILAVGGGFLGASLKGGGSDSGASAQGSFLDDIRERGVLRVGMAITPPHAVELPDGTRGGPNLIPLQNLADAMDVELEVVPAEWANVVAGLQAGRYDFAANLDRTLERSVAIQFTDPVWEYPAALVVEADSPNSTVQELLDSGNPIGTAQGTAHEAAFIRQLPDANTVPTDTFANLLQSLRADRIVGYVADLPTAITQAQADDTLRIIMPEPDIYRGLVAYGVPDTADPRSLQTVNVAIERAINEGEMAAAYAEVGYLEEDQLADAGLLK